VKFFVTNLRVYDYRATPHISKGFSPNELMGFDDKQWLPSRHNTIPNEEMKSLAKQNDAIAKANQKKYNDVNLPTSSCANKNAQISSAHTLAQFRTK